MLVSNTKKDLSFILPDNTRLSGDLHITEIQNHSVSSVDCGGNPHQYDETVVQLWINEASKDIAEWRTEKALKIFEIVGEKIEYKDQAELLVEFGDSIHSTVLYSVGSIIETTRDVTIMLTVKPTVCKPRVDTSGELAGCC
ncbi:DUF6428 family protein [Gracilimonas sp. Q87]|uniref:DUF6428 family protein n=1 Tax=Gracilimonas sp. Q87 TaxID=3384766 RepID=UPI003984480D